MENEITKERITQLNIKDPIMIDDLDAIADILSNQTGMKITKVNAIRHLINLFNKGVHNG
jgi:hypothetical protein